MDYSFPIRVAASKFPQSAALLFRDERLSFAELDRACERLAGGLLAAGVNSAPVCSVMLNEPLTVCLYMALARLGVVSVPLNTRLTTGELRYAVEDSGARTLIVDAEFQESGEQLLSEVERLTTLIVVNADADCLLPTLESMLEAPELVPTATIDELEIATITYTSGTTGFPKGVLRTHRANLWNLMNSSLGVPKLPGDVELLNLPLFGIGFIQQSLPTLLAGGAVVLDRKFDPLRAWELIARHRVTFTFLAPTMIAAMLGVDGHRRYDVSSLRMIGIAYEFPERLRKDALERFGDIFINMYGLTEAQLTCTRLGEFAADPSSVGRPMGLARIAIVDGASSEVERGTVGEIVFNGPSTMSGYHDKPTETAEALRSGWVHTGDLGYLDQDGDLHFAGRRKEIIKTGGFSVDPVEIENVILDLASVSEAAVVGTPDYHWGEAVVAVVVTTGSEKDVGEQVVAACREHLAGFKVPKRIVFLAELPKNSTGKVERGKLRELVK